MNTTDGLLKRTEQRQTPGVKNALCGHGGCDQRTRMSPLNSQRAVDKRSRSLGRAEHCKEVALLVSCSALRYNREQGVSMQEIDDKKATGVRELAAVLLRSSQTRSLRSAELKAELAQNDRDAKQEVEVSSILTELAAALERAHWCQAVRIWDGSGALKKLLERSSETDFQKVADLRELAAERADDALAGLGTALPSALTSVGLELDASSRIPTFTLSKGFFKLEINKKSRVATISVRHGHSFTVAADVELIVPAILAENARCFPNQFDLPAFVSRLQASYSTLLNSDKCGAMPLDKVRREFRNPEMKGDEFAAALAAVIREHPPEAAGMKLDHTKSIETGFLLPGFEDRGYFGQITFEIVLPTEGVQNATSGT